jgi:hypothetical protein
MLKIQRKTNGGVVFTLSGRIEAEDIDELRRLLELEGPGNHVALDLKDVTLVDLQAARFLTECEASGVQLENCPPYVRQRIERESGSPGRKKKYGRTDKPKKGEPSHEPE